MNKNIRDAQQVIYSLIPLNSSKSAANKLARAAFYLNEQVWQPALAV